MADTPKGYRVSNKRLYNSLVSYLKELEKDPSTQIPDDIVRDFYTIAQGFMARRNVCGYLWKDEVIQQACEWFVRYVRKFDPEKSQNPFGYFSRIVETSFLQTLRREKKQMGIRESMVIEEEENFHLGINAHDQWGSEERYDTDMYLNKLDTNPVDGDTRFQDWENVGLHIRAF